jgi:hypothetical protein
MVSRSELKGNAHGRAQEPSFGKLRNLPSRSICVLIVEILRYAQEDNARREERALGLDRHTGLEDRVGQAIAYLLTWSSGALCKSLPYDA